MYISKLLLIASLCITLFTSCNNEDVTIHNLSVVFEGESNDIDIQIYSLSNTNNPIYISTHKGTTPLKTNLNIGDYILRATARGSLATFNEVSFQIQKKRETQILYDKNNIGRVLKNNL